MRISLIWAMTRNRVIGRGNALPWQLPKEMKHFRRSTLDSPVVMGRKTLESMGGPLSRRHNIVLSSRPVEFSGVHHVTSMPEALRTARRLAPTAPDIWIAGGAQVYRAALPYAHRLVCTLVNAALDGDVFFPEFDLSEWQLKKEIRYEADEENPFDFVVQYFNRISPPLALS